MNILPQHMEAFAEHAKASFPEEACAVIHVRDGVVSFLTVPNRHHDPRAFFRIAREDIAGLDVVCLIHSHPNSPELPSDADRAMCNELKLPWAIYSVVTNRWLELLPEDRDIPLIGRTFVYGVFDCFTLVRDYYWQKLRIKLPHIEAPYGFWNDGKEPYLENFARAGFFAVRDNTLRPHDCVLMQYASRTTNHSGVITSEGLLLHHTQGNLSCITPYGGYWLEHTREHVRHHSLC